MSGTWIIVLHYSGVEDTRACLRSLKNQTVESLRVVLVNNAPDDGSFSRNSDELADVHVIQNGINLGWAGGNNIGIRFALEHGAERVVLFNNDAIADPRLIERLDLCGELYPDFGILGPIVCDLEPPHEVQTDGFTFNDPAHSGFFRQNCVASKRTGKATDPEIFESDIVMGCCLWVRRQVFDSIGMIDERFFLIHEESEFCLRAAHAGFKIGVLAESLVRHRKSPSFDEVERRTGKPWQTYFDVRNLWLLISFDHSAKNGRRNRRRSWREYLLYVYYIHSDATDRREPRRARAVAEGFSDAVFHRWGPYVDRRRPFATYVDAFLKGARRVRRMFGESR
jgi:GT2 family glycosyltransferase